MSENCALALDLGGTKLEGALVDASGAIIASSRNRVPTGPDSTPESLADAFEQVVRTSLAHVPDGAIFVGTGIGSAGPIDFASGAIYPVNMPQAHGFEVVAVVRRIVSSGSEVTLRLDGTCLALAENRWGAAQGSSASMSVVVSTGIGGGIVIDGRTVTGRSGNAGHIGQTHVSTHDLPGGQADAATVEQLASGPNIVRWAQSQGWAGETGEDLARSAAAGDRMAVAAVERSATLVGRAFADAATLLDLETIVVGGGFSHVSPDYVDLVGESLRSCAPLDYARRVSIVRSALHGDGPLLGAAALAL
ncbi:MAG: ROK family protein [Microbacteriaceae bacterium]|uniref:ROK family protein n=1 Tax=unclassified Microbacterium TaxID=2609290 RepID=UPI00097E9278|nr:ROK family protein [Microbacterium sp. JB110]SJM64217.1 Transcriptional regulator/sugar kinase [Frigoribacterium sp. JB110]